MSTTFEIKAGDTFESVSRRAYGTEEEADHIARANPGVSEPLTAGSVLVIPPVPDTPEDLPQAQTLADTREEVAVLIDNKRFRFWDKVRVTSTFDQMDTVEFGAPFEASNAEFRETFRPFSFKSCVVTVGGVPLFTGIIISITPVLATSKKSIVVRGYALPGVLNDCTAPASSFPLEFNNQNLRDISKAVARPFGLSVDFRDNPGSVFDRVASEPGKKVLSFLTDLAKQRNLIISSSPAGRLLFWKEAGTGQPVARLQQGASPLLAVAPSFNPQGYYSHITGLEPVVVGLAGSQYTVRNTRLNGVLRPFTFATPDTLDADVKEAVSTKMGRMFGNMVSYEIQLDTWRDSSGELWTPNTTLTVTAPDAMIYSEYEFLIRTVVLSRNSTSETATLNVVLPGSFKGAIPEALPWDD